MVYFLLFNLCMPTLAVKLIDNYVAVIQNIALYDMTVKLSIVHTIKL